MFPRRASHSPINRAQRQVTVHVVLSTHDTRLNEMHVPGSRTGIGGQVGVDLTGGNREAMLKTTNFIWVISSVYAVLGSQVSVPSRIRNRQFMLAF